jgi:hypothetical protein
MDLPTKAKRSRSRSKSRDMRGSTINVNELPGSRHAHHTRHNHNHNHNQNHNETHIPKIKRVRGISYTETMYPDVDTAKRAFEQERNQAIMNRAPTPFIRGGEDEHGDDEEQTVMARKASNRTLRSRVSFDSTRSRRSVRTIHDPRTDAGLGDDSPIGAWEPGFGARNGIGPGGEAYEVIGLGRKSPRHRKLHAQMLKPAIKSTSRVASRSNLREDGPSHSHPHSHDHRRPSRSRRDRDKPLPSRPQSYFDPVFGNIFQSTTNVSRLQPGPTSPVSPQFQSQFQPNSHSQSHSQNQSRTHRHHRSASTSNPSALPFRSLFSSMSMDPSPSSSRQTPRPSHQQRREPLDPAEDLFGYLLLATVPSWRNWPASGPQSRQSGFWNANRAKGFESMGWKWRRRQQLAEMNRMTRGLRAWDGADKYWDNKIIECTLTCLGSADVLGIDDNVPSRPIDPANRWGNQYVSVIRSQSRTDTRIFAIPATGFGTVDFFDDKEDHPEDRGLVTWLSCTVSLPPPNLLSQSGLTPSCSEQSHQSYTCFDTPLPHFHST